MANTRQTDDQVAAELALRHLGQDQMVGHLVYPSQRERDMRRFSEMRKNIERFIATGAEHADGCVPEGTLKCLCGLGEARRDLDEVLAYWQKATEACDAAIFRADRAERELKASEAAHQQTHATTRKLLRRMTKLNESLNERLMVVMADRFKR